LQQVAARLRGSLRESDTLARLYGDEFAILLPGNDATTAAEVAQKLLGALAPPCLLQGQPEQIAASIGIAVYPAHATEAIGLMAQADAAMYIAKHAQSGYALAGFGEGQEHPRHTGSDEGQEQPRHTDIEGQAPPRHTGTKQPSTAWPGCVGS